MLQKAIETAVIAHKHQKRKGSKVPYIIHPIEVSIILTQNGCEEEVIIAGILHDTVEDTDVTLEEIKEQFGEKVAKLVEGASEPDKSLPWKVRKEHTIHYLREEAPMEVKLISCADKLSNLRSIERDLHIMGDKIWDCFHAPFEEQKWYYESMIDSLRELENITMYQECKSLIKQIFG